MENAIGVKSDDLTRKQYVSKAHERKCRGKHEMQRGSQRQDMFFQP